MTVTDEKGDRLPGAEVRYRRIHREVPGTGRELVPAPGEAVVKSRVLADANGAAALPNLPAGDYVLCGRHRRV
jgi:hypothetical protein